MGPGFGILWHRLLRRTLVLQIVTHHGAIAVKVKQLAFELQKKYNNVIKKTQPHFMRYNTTKTKAAIHASKALPACIAALKFTF